MGQVDTDLSHSDYHRLIEYTNGYSSADLNSLCKEAAMVPLREIPAAQLMTMKSAK
jgi:SpoVK/Ycf46/Vps4 family AAA+-type ATPase